MAPSTLAEYYQQQGQSLPSLQERAPLYSQYGGQGNYQGTAEQNTFLLGKLTSQEKTTPTTAPTPGTGTYVEDLAKKYNETSTQTPETTSTVGTSDAERAKAKQAEIEKIKTELTAGAEKPTVYKSADEYKKLREEQGIANDESELQAIQNEANLIKQDVRKYSATAGEMMTEAGRTGAVSEAERNANFRLEDLAIREQAVTSRINAKNTYINTMLGLGQKDYTNALNDYNTEYQINSKAVDLFNSQADDLVKSATASLTTTINLLTEKGITYDSLNDATKSQIDTLALQAGMPQGLIQEAMSIAPEDKIQSVAERTDAQGNTYFDILRVDQDGGAYVQKVYRGTEGGGGTGLTPAQINATVNQIAGAFDNEQIVKNYNTVNEGYQTISSIGTETSSPADDIAFIYAFAKIMDPNSVVREGEYNTIQKYAQTWADNFGFSAKRIFSNTNFLTSDAKQKMLNTLAPKVNTITNQYNNLYNEYQRQISDAYAGKPRQLTQYSGGNVVETGENIIPNDEAAKIMTEMGIPVVTQPVETQPEKKGSDWGTIGDIINWFRGKEK